MTVGASHFDAVWVVKKRMYVKLKLCWEARERHGIAGDSATYLALSWLEW